jgi:hypothetical protein
VLGHEDGLQPEHTVRFEVGWPMEVAVMLIASLAFASMVGIPALAAHFEVALDAARALGAGPVRR